MKLTIGENIRIFRQKRNITQEVFAKILGVTYQSVSRWENDICYPDMELLPDIAEFFGITVDKLIGADKNVEQKEVKRYLERFQEAISRGAIYKCIDIAREGISIYPNNYALLNKLMLALFASGDDSGNIPEWRENMLKYDAEITELGERIMKYCPDPDIRSEATARLAFNHCEMGRRETGRRIYEMLPSMEHSREKNIYWALDGEEQMENTRQLIRQSYDTLSYAMSLLANEDSVCDTDKLKIYQKQLILDGIIYDDDMKYVNFDHAKIYYRLAKIYARQNEIEEAFHALELAVQNAKAFDERPDTAVLKSLLWGEHTIKRTDFNTADSRPICEILRDTWLASSDFDSIRQLVPFQKVIEKLL